ncbi:hypothetical protein B0H15DRAFT_955624 [Mycena belliarum]|uniref:Uncharacterized protein n=1 Tax=Mycena belliarum TaxID=1033014 RepID=A0AAD6TSS0_9AGAR|nr:hypothetical protein B0H15DRAFT_955624 [Mycena belliae]
MASHMAGYIDEDEMYWLERRLPQGSSLRLLVIDYGQSGNASEPMDVSDDKQLMLKTEIPAELLYSHPSTSCKIQKTTTSKSSRCLDLEEPIFETGVQFITSLQIGDTAFFALTSSSDCGRLNTVVGLSQLYPYVFHSVKFWRNPTNDGLAYSILTRTKCWPRYHIIDFVLSRRYNSHRWKQ